MEEFQCLNRIEEGTFGVVYRARDKTTDEIVALKRLKMEKEKEGFPITSLREINTLLKVKYLYYPHQIRSNRQVFSVQGTPVPLAYSRSHDPYARLLPQSPHRFVCYGFKFLRCVGVERILASTLHTWRATKAAY